LSPLPKAQPRSVKRKAEAAEVLISTPFKQTLLEKQLQQLKLGNQARRKVILQEKKIKKTVATTSATRGKKAPRQSASVGPNQSSA